MNELDIQKIECSACETFIDKLETSDFISYDFPFLGTQKFNYTKIVCPICGHANVDNNFENNLQSFVDSMELKNTISAIDSLKNLKYSFSYLERALRIPYRTFSRWKSQKDYGAVSKSYINIISNFPWIAKVSEEDFSDKAKLLNLLQASITEALKYNQNHKLESEKQIQEAYRDILINLEKLISIPYEKEIVSIKGTFSSNTDSNREYIIPMQVMANS